jgi:hypothetical protein
MSKSEFVQILDVLGITTDSTLVFYDDELSIVRHCGVQGGELKP